MKKLALHWKIIIGLLLGIIWAYISAIFGWSTFTKHWIAPWGEIFINLLKLIAIPLVLFSIIVGISGLSDIKRLGRVGAKTLGIYLLTTVVAVSLGLVLVNVIKPGKYLDENQRVKNRITYELWAQENNIEIKDHQSYLTNPDYKDFVDDASQQYEVEKNLAEVDQDLAKRKQQAKKTKEAGPLAFLIDMVPSNIFVSLADNKLMLQIIFFAIFFGIVLLMIDKKKADNVAGIVDGFNEVFLKMVDIVMKAAPFFVFALMAAKLSEMAGDDPKAIQEIIINLGWYSLVVVIGLAFLVFVVYPLIMTRVLKIGYTTLFRKISPAQLLAFSSSSSAATLPITMECVNDNLKVPEEVSSFVLPIGATVNMDGTSLYQSIAVIYLAQIHLIDLDMAQQLTIVATATLASIGSAAVPSAGLVMLMIVLDAVGLNPAWIAIIFPVDRILDMMRTVVNVTGDITVSSVIAKSEGFMKK
ncbi:MAG: dicarboxylate/amino acid:cation symporter [Vicingaceae bacterium]|nr:dicarboxylate/amino acid:cation symporter [Vicingaceae bacterium]